VLPVQKSGSLFKTLQHLAIKPQNVAVACHGREGCTGTNPVYRAKNSGGFSRIFTYKLFCPTEGTKKGDQLCFALLQDSTLCDNK
jgi:hypothetical protein